MAAPKKAPTKKRASASKAATVASAPAKKPAARSKKSAKVSGAALQSEKRLTLLMAIFTALSLIFASLVFYWYA